MLSRKDGLQTSTLMAPHSCTTFHSQIKASAVMNSHNVYDTITRCTYDTLEAVHHMEPHPPANNILILLGHPSQCSHSPQSDSGLQQHSALQPHDICSRKSTLQPHHVRSRITQYAATSGMQPHGASCRHLTYMQPHHVCSHITRVQQSASQPRDVYLAAARRTCSRKSALSAYARIATSKAPDKSTVNI